MNVRGRRHLLSFGWGMPANCFHVVRVTNRWALPCGMRTKWINAPLALAAIGALVSALPAQASSTGATCTDCGVLPAWLLGILAFVGVLIAMAILWLPQRMVRDVRNPRLAGLIVLGGWVILTIAFVLGIRALVLVLGGS
jgi:hypothetical protein